MFTTRPELRGTFGMVSSTHWLASQAGMAALERGGNAFDAAATTGMVLEVVEPHLNGLGGEVPIILWSDRDRRVEVICGQGPAPRAATIDRFQELGVTSVPGTGPLAACVPGAFGGWMTLLRDFGTLRLRDVLEPAIGYAENGYPVVPRVSEAIAAVEALFREHWQSSAHVYLSGGVPEPLSTFRNPDLAATYRRLLAEGEAAGGSREAQIEAALRAFYEGFVAEAIDAARATPRMDSSGEAHAGFLVGADLAGWRPSREKPVSLDYRGWTICKTGPWGQGPVFLQQLALLSGYDLGRMGFLSPDHIHTVVEAAKLAFADREAWYGDPNFVDVPLAALLDPGYADGRRRLVGESASLEVRPGAPDGREPRLPRWTVEAIAAGHWTGAGAQAVGETGTGNQVRGDTCHVDAADRFGNLVAATPSGGWLQSSPVIPGLGFCLGTRAQMFSLDPGLPSSLEGGKRPRTTLTPSLALRSGEPVLAFGTPGGDQQDQWSLEFFLAHVDFGLNLQEAIDAPNFHSQHFPSSFAPHQAFPGRVSIEDRVEPGTVEELRRRGHEVVVGGPWSLGRLCAAGFDRERGQLVAAANPRGMQGYAVGR
ncbi:MAG: gamma-glutamyltransferase family protein [Candidatus Dormibacteraeota bacterium]|nr:gamma-glutamyltransferase family protein [Candidatus Dormibacteraeota bacterium]